MKCLKIRHIGDKFQRHQSNERQFASALLVRGRLETQQLDDGTLERSYSVWLQVETGSAVKVFYVARLALTASFLE